MASNGRLPASSLAPIPGSGPYGGPTLRKDAAAAYQALHRESVRRWGISMALHESSIGRAYRNYSRQQLAYRTYGSGRAAYPGTSNHGYGIAVDLMNRQQRWVIDQIGHLYGFSKRWSDACVPLDTRILTRRGWLTWDQVEEGVDETVGVDPVTGTAEWTVIHSVYRQESSPVVEYGHSFLRLRCTPNHRWVVQPREGGEGRLMALDDCTDGWALVQLAAAGSEGEGLPLTTEEATLLGWALTDGSIYRFKNSRGVRAYARIYQKKAVGVAEVEKLMEAFLHKRFDNWTGDSSYSGGASAWYIGRGAFSPVLERSRLDELGPVGMVVAMSSDQRRAFLTAAQMAEGYQNHGMRQIAASKPSVREAIATAAALEGYVVTLRPPTVNLCNPAARVRSLRPTPIGQQPTWCPGTALGTWTAEQDGQVFVTSNSHEWWHVKFKAGVYKPRPDYAFLTDEERRVYRRWRRLKRRNKKRRKRGKLFRWMIARRKAIYRAANKTGWGKHRRRRRYRFFTRVTR